MKVRFALFIASCFIACNSFASELIYLGCDLPSPDNKPTRHFDITLDEQNGTVSCYIKEANATNKEKAVFGPETVTWTNNITLRNGIVVTKINRTINRTDLSFVEEVDTSRYVGACQIVTPAKRKF